MIRTKKVTAIVGKHRVVIVHLSKKMFEVAIVTSKQPSQFAESFEDALELFNSMITAVQWLYETGE